MKALVWCGEKNFSLKEVPAPKAEPGRVVVKVEAAAICGSDLHLADFKAQPPLIPGHEAAGIIAEIGAGRTSLKVGQRVALDPVQRCGTCWCCTHNTEHLCSNYRHLGDGQTPGAWAEFVAIDAANVYGLPENVPFTTGCMVEPMAVCYESFQRAALRPGESVLILGDGPFGLVHAMHARAAGARVIVVAGHYPERLKRIAAASGASTCNTHHEDLSQTLAARVGAAGVDVAIEATGSAAAVNLGLKALRPRGRLVIFSYVWKPEPLEMGLIHMRELNVLGSCRSQNAYQACLNLLAEKKVDLGLLADMVAPLDEHATAMERLRRDKRSLFKVVFKP